MLRNNKIVVKSRECKIPTEALYLNCNIRLIYGILDDPNFFFLLQLPDIDECMMKTSGCSEYCTNLEGRFTCSCQPGLKLSQDMKTCTGKT